MIRSVSTLPATDLRNWNREKMQIFKDTLFYLKEYGFRNLLRKIPIKLARSIRWTLSDARNKYIVEKTKAVKSQISPIKIFTCPGALPRVNLVLDQNKELNDGITTALLLGIIIAARLKFDLRIISSPEINTQDFHDLLAASGHDFEKTVEFIADDTAVANHEIEVTDSDIFVTTSWQTTRKVIGSINENNVIYLLQYDERKLCQSIETSTQCTDIFRNNGIRFIVSSRNLYDQLLADGFANIQQQGSCYDAPAETNTTDDIKTITRRLNDVIDQPVGFEKSRLPCSD